MFSLSPTAKMSWQDPAGLTVLVFSRALIYTHLSLPNYAFGKMKVMIFVRYTWPSGRWEEATYVMGVKQGREVEVRSHFMT